MDEIGVILVCKNGYIFGDSERIILNVGGVWYEMYVLILWIIVNIWLVRLVERYLRYKYRRDEYFFDRYLFVFNFVIDYYRMGKYFLNCIFNI